MAGEVQQTGGEAGGLPVLANGSPDLAALREQGRGRHVDVYLARLNAVAALRARLQGARHGERGSVAERVAVEHGATARSVRRWDRLEREGGPLGLLPKWGTSNHRERRIPRELAAKIRDAFLDQRRSTSAQIFRDLVVPFCVREGIPVPHDRTVRRLLAREVLPIEQAVWRGGPRKFEAEFAAKVTRDPTELAVNEVWVGDHRLLDIFLLYHGKAIRPWLAMIADVRSAAIVGSRLCLRPNASSVAHALRSALLAVGPPKVFLRDNGKEFTAKRVGGKARRLRRPRQGDLGEARRWPPALPREVEDGALWSALRVEVKSSLPYHAWSKPIESFFRSLSQQWENMLPAWCGRNAADKPELLPKHVAEGKLLTWQQLPEIWDKIEVHWNTDRPVGARPETPLQAYEGYVAEIPDDRALALLLQKRGERKVADNGITCDGALFFSPAALMYVGQTVRCRWDPADLSGIVVYPPDQKQPLAVPRKRPASWRGFGKANEDAKRARRAQREFVMGRRAEVAGAASLEEVDPLGAFRAVARRRELEAAVVKKRLALPAPEKAAAAQAKARRRAVEPPQETSTQLLGRQWARDAEEVEALENGGGDGKRRTA